MTGWQPQGYDPRQQRPVTPPQWQQRAPQPAPGWQQHISQPPYPPQVRTGQPQAHYPQQQPAPRKRRVFLWVFLAIQALFLIWIIAGVAAHPAGASATQQAAQQCANGGWQGLFKSQADCQVHYAHALNEASTAGKGIGVALIVIVWVVVDFFLGLGYGIYRLASRR